MDHRSRPFNAFGHRSIGLAPIAGARKLPGPDGPRQVTPWLLRAPAAR
jgi:hypothetical protein